jgi:hypothetical protein
MLPPSSEGFLGTLSKMERGFLSLCFSLFGCSTRGLACDFCALVGSTGGEIGSAEKAMAHVMVIIRCMSVARKTCSTAERGWIESGTSCKRVIGFTRTVNASERAQKGKSTNTHLGSTETPQLLSKLNRPVLMLVVRFMQLNKTTRTPFKCDMRRVTCGVWRVTHRLERSLVRRTFGESHKLAGSVGR